MEGLPIFLFAHTLTQQSRNNKNKKKIKQKPKIEWESNKNSPTATGSVATAVVIWFCVCTWPGSYASSRGRIPRWRGIIIKASAVRRTAVATSQTGLVAWIASAGIRIGFAGLWSAPTVRWSIGSGRCVSHWGWLWWFLLFLFRFFGRCLFFAAAFALLLFDSGRSCCRMIWQEATLKRFLFGDHFDWSTRPHIGRRLGFGCLFGWRSRRCCTHGCRRCGALGWCAGIGAGRTGGFFGSRCCCCAAALWLLRIWCYWSIWMSAVSLTKIMWTGWCCGVIFVHVFDCVRMEVGQCFFCFSFLLGLFWSACICFFFWSISSNWKSFRVFLFISICLFGFYELIDIHTTSTLDINIVGFLSYNVL